MWFEEYDNVKVDNAEENEDNESYNEEVTFEDLEQLVKKVNQGNDVQNNISLLQEYVNELLFIYEQRKDSLEEKIDHLWNIVMVPYLEYEKYTVFRCRTSHIYHKFYKWIYDNSNTGKKLDYLYLLNDKLDKIYSIYATITEEDGSGKYMLLNTLVDPGINEGVNT